MDRLSAHEGRVLASLVEKQMTVPQSYPLTLHALLAACNQSTSREPVTELTAEDVLGAVESLKAKGLARAVLPSHGRSVVRYRQVMDEALGLVAAQLAVVALLELRGPQTSAELRSRMVRMADVASVDRELDLLSGREEPLVERIGRRPGQKEDRWVSLLADPFSTPGTGDGDDGAAAADVALRAEMGAMRVEVDELRAAVDELRAAVDELRASLGG